MSSLTEQMVELMYKNKDEKSRDHFIDRFLVGIMYQLLRNSSVCFSLDAEKIKEFESLSMGIDIDTEKNRVYLYSMDSINQHLIHDGEVDLDVLFSANPSEYPIYNGWVDVSVAKPPEKVPVFVNNKRMPVIGYYGKPPNHTEYGFFSLMQISGNEILIPLENVTHWMPLPVCPDDSRLDSKSTVESNIARTEPEYMKFGNNKSKKSKKKNRR